MNIKSLLSKLLANYALPLSYEKDITIDTLCYNVTKFHSGNLSQSKLLKELHSYFKTLDSSSLCEELNFDAIRKDLIPDGKYKYNINDNNNKKIRDYINIKNRRFSIMRHLGMKTDVIILRKNEYIPPHAHKRMVSGFYVLEGSIGVRHYNLIEKSIDSILIKKTIDTTYGIKQFTTNSDDQDNIHWLKGVSDISFLYRVSIIDKGKEEGNDNMGANERIYINPTIAPGADGLIHAPYINEEYAKSLTFQHKNIA